MKFKKRNITLEIKEKENPNQCSILVGKTKVTTLEIKEVSDLYDCILQLISFFNKESKKPKLK